jgi:hypothetical protein
VHRQGRRGPHIFRHARAVTLLRERVQGEDDLGPPGPSLIEVDIGIPQASLRRAPSRGSADSGPRRWTVNGWPHADTGAIDRLRVRSPDTRRWYASLQRNVTVERRAGLCSKTSVRTRAGYSGPQSLPITLRRLDSPAHWAGCCFRTVSVRRIWLIFEIDRKVAYFGGERGIRTLEGLMTLTPLAGQRANFTSAGQTLSNTSTHAQRLKRPLPAADFRSEI